MNVMNRAQKKKQPTVDDGIAYLKKKREKTSNHISNLRKTDTISPVADKN